MNSQDITIQTYRENFETYKQKTSNEVSGEFIMFMEEFIERLPKEGSVLEIGSAHGRDARYLRNKGLLVTCTDVIPQALEELKASGFTATLYDFRDKPKPEWLHAFDGIFAKAVYLHATQEVFEASLDMLSFCLRDGGIFCLTFKLGEGEEIETDKLVGERYFKYYNEEALRHIINNHKQYTFLNSRETSDGKWIQVLLQKIISRDLKS